jgi:hypothetical protein
MIYGLAFLGGGSTFYLKDFSSFKKSSLECRGFFMCDKLVWICPDVPEPLAVVNPIPLYIIIYNLQYKTS